MLPAGAAKGIDHHNTTQHQKSANNACCEGPIEPWMTPGPFLGVAEAEFPTHYGQLNSGHKLLFASDGTVPSGHDGQPNTSVMMRSVQLHRRLAVQPFVDAVAHELFQHMIPNDDFTLLAIEWTNPTEGTA